MRPLQRLFGPRIETRFVTTISLVVTCALVAMIVVATSQFSRLQTDTATETALLLVRWAAASRPGPPGGRARLPAGVWQVSYRSPRGLVHLTAGPVEAPLDLATEEGPAAGRVRSPVGDVIVFRVRDAPPGRPARVGWVAFDAARLWRATGAVVGGLFAIAAAILISCLFLGVFLARTALAPLARFTASIRQIRAGELAPLLVPEAPENFGEFQGAFNVLLEQIRRNQEMERALLAQDKMATVGRLAAAVAHETRNPLAAISSLTQILADELREVPRQRKYTQVILKEVKRLDENIANLLEYARPMHPDFKPADPAALVRDVVVLLRFEARRRGVLLVEETGAAPPARWRLDQNQIKQVLVNLVTNALGFSRVGDRVTVGLGLARPGRLRAWVRDEGPGVPAEHREKIFQPFFSRRQGGTGLGLAVARRIIEAHGGEIRVADGPAGRGAEFSFELPEMERAPPVAPDPDEGPSPWPARRRD